MVAEGESQTGKSTVIKIAMSLIGEFCSVHLVTNCYYYGHLHIGLSDDCIYEDFTNTFILERACVSTLPFAIDDPASSPRKGRDLNEIVVDLFIEGNLFP